jgi:hypothetical protein
MRLRIAVFGTIGVLATLVAGVFVVAPELPLAVGLVEQAVSLAAGVDPKRVMVGATVAVGLYVALAARSSPPGRTPPVVSDATRRFDRAVSEPPEAVTADRRALTAASLDADVDRAVEAGGEELQDVRAVLTELTVETYATRHQQPLEVAEVAVKAGTWTDDDVAAAFLGDADGPRPSLLSRIRLWLVPERERERRIERTVAALTALGETRP